ncbi:hypothetical protein P1J78_02660 [Psychromarinibacter sp. C21-152]|uniref:ATP-grasp domain-containing protein n=1 Tax=Psychromarinibacter sediminicola TaxID=3033385 RepID=A0AAE3NQ52_9RHOB|nr:hypothetical protein [Psychromarinibacter sediminicola]MDF0599624.1 hypothetical protein [Psychromarinibacter sediminicola]
MSDAAGMVPRGVRLPRPGLPRLYRARRLLDLSAAVQRRRIAPVRQRFYDRLWAEAAREIGATVEPTPLRLTCIRRGPMVTYLRESEVMLDNALMFDVVGDKAFCYRLFADRGLPVPAYCAFSPGRLADAETFLELLGAPVAVKPMAGTGGGRGVTTGIRTAAALRRAARYASGYGPRLLAEEELGGESIRLLYLDGVFLDAVRRERPRVTGDGRSTLRALIRQENVRRRDAAEPVALSPLRLDEDMRNTLARQGLGLRHVPAAGTEVTVKGAVNENAAAQNHSIRDAIHPDIVDRIGRLVRDMGVRFAGVDLLAGDVSRPLAETDAVVHEVNANPGLHHHVLISDPAARAPVAQRVLAHLFETGSGVVDP